MNDFSSLYWIFTNFSIGYWMPLTWLSFAFDYQIGGNNPVIYHITNLVIHTFNVLLVFFISLRLMILITQKTAGITNGSIHAHCLRTALLASILFGAHPIHVESVAWASERKDVLCAFFFFGGILFYLKYAVNGKNRMFYFFSTFMALIAALMSKPIAITLPLVFLLLDIWPLERARGSLIRILAEKIPFFASILVYSIITFSFQSQEYFTTVNFSYRFMNSFHVIVFYVWKMVIPSDFAVLYPIFLRRTFSIQYVFEFIIVISITLFFFIFRQKKPFLWSSWLFYLITLFPTLNLLQMLGSQSAADRWTYIPSLGIFLPLAGCLSALFSKRNLYFILLSTVITLLIGSQTIRQIGIWKDSVSLWEHTVKTLVKNSALSYAMLGDAYLNASRNEDALKAFNHVKFLDNSLTFSYFGIGKVLLNTGRLDESMEEFNTILKLKPQNIWAHGYLAIIFEKKGAREQAIREAQTALFLEPKNAWPHFELGGIYRQNGMNAMALAEMLRAVEIDPGFADTYENLATIYRDTGQMEKSEEAHLKADSLRPVLWKLLRRNATNQQ